MHLFMLLKWVITVIELLHHAELAVPLSYLSVSQTCLHLTVILTFPALVYYGTCYRESKYQGEITTVISAHTYSCMETTIHVRVWTTLRNQRREV